MKVSPEVVKQIAEELDSGLRCFLHIDTHEVVALPDQDQLLEIDTEPWEDDIERVYNDPDKFKEIDKMLPRESFQVMEDFVETIKDNGVQRALAQALNGKKPFANFKWIIDQSGRVRDQWFLFKNERACAWVNDQLEDID